MKEWIKCAGIRALKTMAQTAVSLIGVCSVISDVDWVMVGSASLLAGILSLLTSIAGLPEVNKGIEELQNTYNEDTLKELVEEGSVENEDKD